MTGRPITVVLAAGLMFLNGASGVLVGGELPVAGAGVGSGVGALISLGFAAYGLACVVAALGIFLSRSWARWLALALMVLGLEILVWMLFVLIGAEPHR